MTIRIPPFYTKSSEDEKGFDVFAYRDVYGKSTGCFLCGVNIIREDSTGFDVSGHKEVYGNWRGFDISGVKHTHGSSKGVDLSGLKIGDGESTGASISLFANNEHRSEGFLFQYGTFANVVDDVPPDSCLVQIGFYNKIDDSWFPLIHVRGLRNIPNLIRGRRGPKLELER
jgi:hypothetical protein